MQKDRKGFEGLTDSSNPDLGEIRGALQGKGEWRPQLLQPIGEDAANGAIAEREACKPTPERTGVGNYCQPGDRREPRWIVMYDDADRTHSVFEDEQDARDCFAASEGMGWNCWLFSPTPRAAHTAEKVAAQVVDSAIVDCDIDMARAVRAATHEVSLDPYMGAPQPAQTQVALTQERIRKIAEEHFWGGKCTTADDLEKAIVAALCEASLAAQPVSGGKS